MTLEIHNHGHLIISTNYWQSEHAAAGKFYASVNAGAIRLLVPQSRRADIEDMRAAKQVILSRGPWPEQMLPDAVEILFDDLSDNPYVLHLSHESFDLLPAESDQWIISVWDEKKGRPHKSIERPCQWRRVPRIPWLRPWK
jgi:hypothetical protein